MSTEPTFISINERAYKYIRQFSIKSVEDALVELITNSFDAYKYTTYESCNLEIDIKNPSIVKVRDFALGLTSDGLNNCFLQVGNFTAGASSRGFFSRGAKDISAIGNITFTTIKDNKYSQCVLDTDAYGNITVADIDATDQLRESCGILNGNNGLEVTIELLPNFQNIDVNKLGATIRKIGTLRNILKDTTKNFIYLRELNSDDAVISKNRIYYVPIAGSLVLDVSYKVPGYEQYDTRFIVYKADKPIDQPLRDSLLEFGFLIEDNTSVYEVSTLDDRFRWNPYMNYLFGSLHCNGIHEMLADYDENGASSTNPYPIIDPSRLTGVNKQHPLIKNILSIPLVRLDQILRELNTTVSAKNLSINEIDDLLDDLSSMGIDIIKQNDININWTPNYDSNLAKAIVDQREKYINYEKSYMLNTNYNTEEVTLNNTIKDQITQTSSDPNLLYVYDRTNNQLVQIKDVNFDQISSTSINVINMLPDNVKGVLKTNPYIYRINPQGNKLEQLYIFENGTLDTNTAANLSMKSKQFVIQFINDLNLPTRYIIDNSGSSITVKINLNNPIVNKYLGNGNSTNFVINDISSTKSLLFMVELVTNILADLIVDNDVMNGKLILDSDNYSNGRRTIDYRNNIITTIETKISALFDKYIANNANKKLGSILDIINQISVAVGEAMVIPDSLKALHSDLQNTLLNVVE